MQNTHESQTKNEAFNDFIDSRNIVSLEIENWQ